MKTKIISNSYEDQSLEPSVNDERAKKFHCLITRISQTEDAAIINE